MKPILVLAIAALLLIGPALRAQTPEAAAAIANKQADEERYKRLNSQLEDLQAMIAAQGQKIEELTRQLASLRDEQARRESGFASVETVKKLADDIQAVDAKRVADNKLVREELAKLLKAVSDLPDRGSRPPAHAEDHSFNSGNPQKGFVYTIRKNDTLTAISAAYRTQGYKVTVEDILKANPGLKPEQMQIGDKIFIPNPGD